MIKAINVFTALALTWGGVFTCSVGAQDVTTPSVERTGDGPMEDDDRAEALTVWKRYAECLKDRDFEPCFSLLSRKTLEVWQQQYSVKTSSEYADVKGSEEISYTDLRVSKVNRKGRNIILTVRARRDGEGGEFVYDMEVLLVKESGKWRIDTVSSGGIEYLP